MSEKSAKAKISSKDRMKLKHFIIEVEKYRRGGTELVSVYVPSGYDLNGIISHLQQEQSTASNIKSKSTQKNVTDALEKMIQHLKLFKRTPENGLFAFSGNVAEKEGTSDVKVWSVEPPIPSNLRLYRCDKSFILDALKDMIMTTEVYGMVVLDNRDADIALLKGKTIVPMKSTHSEVPGKMRAGGQSAPRFARLRELAIKDHFKKIADYMKDEFLPIPELKGIILGGPGTTVNSFVNTIYITGDVRKKIIGVLDLSYTGDFGLQELLDKAGEILVEDEVADEKKVMQEFFYKLSQEPGKVAYGIVEVQKNLEMGVVDRLLISEELDSQTVVALELKAEEFGTEVKVISTETREGVQLKEIGKIAAILRYDVSS